MRETLAKNSCVLVVRFSFDYSIYGLDGVVRLD